MKPYVLSSISICTTIKNNKQLYRRKSLQVPIDRYFGERPIVFSGNLCIELAASGACLLACLLRELQRQILHTDGDGGGGGDGDGGEVVMRVPNHSPRQQIIKLCATPASKSASIN
ncbi:hypothetical protein Hanom_Chr10g00881881 [Helianthus anomalus]